MIGKAGRHLAAVLAIGAMLLGGCSSDPDQTAESAQGDPVMPQIPVGSRAETFSSTEQLAEASDLVVTAIATDRLTQLEGYGDKTTPIGRADLTVEDVLKGQATSGDTIGLAVPAGFDDGQLTSSFVYPKQHYLLYLTPMGPAAKDGYAVTGAVAGMFVWDGETYLRADTESPGLPEVLTIDAAEESVAAAATE